MTRHSAPVSLGDIFVAPQLGPSQNGPMVLDPFGNLVWFHHSRGISRPGRRCDLRLELFSGRPCRLATTLNAGRTVVARTGGEAVGAGDSGVVYFSLTRGGRKLLSLARGHELAVSASVRNFDRMTSSTSLDVIGYHTRGSAPPYSVRQAPVGITVTNRRHTASERGSLVRFG